MGEDCSQIAPPTFAPPMYPRTPYPGAQGQPTTPETPENTSPNVHIRKFSMVHNTNRALNLELEKDSRAVSSLQHE